MRIDPHHHLWDAMRATSGLATRYMVEELGVDAASANVERTVFVECGWRYESDGPEHMRPVGETRAVRAIAGELVAAIVSSCDLALPAPRLGEVLDAHVLAGEGRFRGIRHRLAHDPTHTGHGDADPELSRRDDFRSGVAELGRRGFSFEAWCFHPQLPDIVALAHAVPGTTIVLNHLGAPIRGGVFAARADEVRDSWNGSITELAACPNVVLKVGGIGMPALSPWWVAEGRKPDATEIADRWGPWIDFAIDAFGADRCMFESNFPVDAVSVTYAELWAAFDQIAALRTPDERAALLGGTASAMYRLSTA